MGFGVRFAPFSLERDIARWRHVGGGSDNENLIVGAPIDYTHAKAIDALAQRYGVTPSVIINESALTLRIAQIASL